MQCHAGCEKQATLSLSKEQTTVLSLMPFDTYLTTICFTELSRQARRVFAWTRSAHVRAVLLRLLRDISVTSCTTQLAHGKDFLLDRLLAWLYNWVSSPAESDDPLSLRFTPVGQ